MNQQTIFDTNVLLQGLYVDRLYHPPFETRVWRWAVIIAPRYKGQKIRLEQKKKKVLNFHSISNWTYHLDSCFTSECACRNRRRMQKDEELEISRSLWPREVTMKQSQRKKVNGAKKVQNEKCKNLIQVQPHFYYLLSDSRENPLTLFYIFWNS